MAMDTSGVGAKRVSQDPQISRTKHTGVKKKGGNFFKNFANIFKAKPKAKKNVFHETKARMQDQKDFLQNVARGQVKQSGVIKQDVIPALEKAVDYYDSKATELREKAKARLNKGDRTGAKRYLAMSNTCKRRGAGYKNQIQQWNRTAQKSRLGAMGALKLKKELSQSMEKLDQDHQKFNKMTPEQQERFHHRLETSSGQPRTAKSERPAVKPKQESDTVPKTEPTGKNDPKQVGVPTSSLDRPGPSGTPEEGVKKPQVEDSGVKPDSKTGGLLQELSQTGDGKELTLSKLTGLLQIPQFRQFVDVGQSGKGKIGVYFLGGGADAQVIKPSDKPVSELFSSALARRMGLETPATKLVSTESGDGKQVKDFISEQCRSKSDLTDKFQSDQTQYLVMEKMDVDHFEGPSNALRERAKGTDKAKFSEDLGKLFMFDLLIGNHDRMPLSRGDPANSRNIFVGLRGQESKLIAMDQEPSLPKDLNGYLAQVKDMVNDPQKTANDVAEWAAQNEALKPFLTEDSGQHILTGIQEGIKTIQAMANSGTINSLCSDIQQKYGDSEFSDQMKDFLGAVAKQF